MSGYGKVISGGASMRKGVSKGINDKLSARESEISRREATAGALTHVKLTPCLSSMFRTFVVAALPKVFVPLAYDPANH